MFSFLLSLRCQRCAIVADAAEIVANIVATAFCCMFCSVAGFSVSIASQSLKLFTLRIFLFVSICCNSRFNGNASFQCSVSAGRQLLALVARMPRVILCCWCENINWQVISFHCFALLFVFTFIAGDFFHSFISFFLFGDTVGLR